MNLIPNPFMKNVYGYIRVSTVKQGEGVSLEVQKEAIERYALQHNLNITRWFEEKLTAAKQGRPLFTEMMRLLKAKKAHGVIMHKIDRSTRNLKDWADLGSLIDQGIEMHFAHESLDLQARGGRLSADIQAIIAADYIRNLRQEAKKGLDGRLKQGFYPFHGPIGYLDTGRGKLKAIDPVYAPLVRLAFELYATGQHTLRELSEHLYSRGLRNKFGRRLSYTSLAKVFHNSFYIGITKVKGVVYEGKHVPLITTALFKQVQEVLSGNNNKKLQKHEYLFQKMIVCKGCGYSLIAERQKGHIYYRCHTKACPTKTVRETRIESFLKQVLNYVQFQSGEIKYLEETLEETRDNWLKKQGDLTKGIELQVTNLKQKLERLTDAFIDGQLEDKEIFNSRKTKFLTEIKEKEHQQQQLSAEKATVFAYAQEFLELAKSLINSYEIGIPKEKRELVKILTSNFVLEGKKLVIAMQSPFLEMANACMVSCGAPMRDSSRKTSCDFVESDDFPLTRKPLSKKQLRELLDLILVVVARQPIKHSEEYDV